VFENLPTPTLLLDEVRLAANIRRMQATCDAHGVALWPHVKPRYVTGPHIWLG